MALSLEGKVVWFAVISRATVLALQVLFNLLIPDHQPDVFNPPTTADHLKDTKIGDGVAEVILSGLRRWDGVYFLHVAEHGYTYQNCLAFFPLFPFVVRFLANSFLWPTQCILSYRYVLQASAVVVNLYCFVSASVMLYKLGTKVLDNEKLAYKAALLFSINPASIFMTAHYSEAMFSYLCFRGLLHFEESKNIRASIRFGVAAAARSNGLVNFGFIYYQKLKTLVLQLYEIKRTRYTDWSTVRVIVSGVLCIDLGPTLLYTLIMFLPFLVWQYFAYSMFCLKHANQEMAFPEYLVAYGKSRNYSLLGGPPPEWCQSYLPFSYSYVQKTHWGVGLLQYYEFKQIPHFVLAFPVVLLCYSMAVCYVRKNPSHTFTLGLTDNVSTSKKSDEPVKVYGLFGTNMLVYVAHMVFLVTVGILFMHIQVLTRFMFSSTPLIYWFAAWLTSDHSIDEETVIKVNRYDIMKRLSHQQHVDTPTNMNSKLTNMLTDQLSQWRQCTTLTKLVYLYFFGYAIIGTALFSNFYPWT